MIKIENLKKNIHNFNLDLSLNINKGEIFGIIGKSGSGKSTLLKIIQGIMKMDSGKIIITDNKNERHIDSNFNNLNFNNLQKNSEIKISYIFQEFNLLYNKTVFDNVLLPFVLIENNNIFSSIISKFSSKIKNKYRKRVEEILEFTHLLEKKDSYISELSGGEKQRVAIARAIVNNPHIILCDEVTTSLDEILKNEILKLFLKINKKYNTTLLFITHELDVVKKICDRVAVMENGKILDTFSIKNNKKNNFEKENKNYLDYVKEVLL